MLAVLALAPEDGFLVDALLRLLGTDATSADFDVMRGAGYLSVDVAVRRCRLSECISRQVAYDNRASDAAIEKIDALLMDYALVSRENISETVFLLLDVAKMAYMLNHSMERRAFYCALCASYSCQVGKVDEVRTFFQEAIEMARACSFETKNDEGIVHSLIGTCYVDGLREYNKALDHIERSLVLLQEQDAANSDVLIGTLAERMKAQALLGRWREACDAFVQCLDGRRWNTKDELVKLCLGTFACYVPEARWTFNRSEVADKLRKSAAEKPPKEIRERFDQLMVVYEFHSTAYLKSESSVLSEEMSEIAHSILANQPKDLGDWGLVITGLSQVESDRDGLSHAINDLLVSLDDSSMSDDLCDLLESCVAIASSAGLYDEAIRCKKALLSLEMRCSDKESALGIVFDIDYACALLGSEGKEAATSYCRDAILAMEDRLADDVIIQYKFLLAVEFLSRRLILDLTDDIAAELNVTIENVVGYIDRYRKATGNNASGPLKINLESGLTAMDQQILYRNLISLVSTANILTVYEEPIAWLCELLLHEFPGIDLREELELYEYVIRYHAEAEDWMEIVLIADEVMSLVTDDSYSKALEEARIGVSACSAEIGHPVPVDDIGFASATMRAFMAVPIAVGQAFSHVNDNASAAKAFLRAAHIMNRVIDIGPSDDPMLRLLLERAGFNEIVKWTLEISLDLPSRVLALDAAKDYLEIAVWTFKNSDAVCGALWHSLQSVFCAIVDAAAKHASELLQSEAEPD